ncbi:hypothetical protein [Bartonella sp. TT119HLJHH]|uniref:hypothetical protein n=1 Tax=Bartonella sp. TT119HLJHH TaxID=3243579 RepID=UPI0035D0239F
MTGEVVKACLDVLGHGGLLGAFVVRAGGSRNERAQVLFHCGDNGAPYAFVLGGKA